MSNTWYSVDLFPDAPRQLPCDYCGHPSKVWAVQKNDITGRLLCSIECEGCGTREVDCTDQQSVPADPRD